MSVRYSRYDNRARAIHGDRKQFKPDPPSDISANDYWKKHVRTPEDVVKFYQLYFPYYPQELVMAIADYFHRIVKGEIPLPEHLDQNKVNSGVWDFRKDIEDQKLEAQIKKASEALEGLLEESDEEVKAPRHCKKHK